ncbi:hypothetical protein Taro_038118 [Colocasia esculenta]|uniref:Uncharacterized protein n=1 Tax=Colocasia esculenta TaxID=4460 RepID=A0A843WBU7_COLES|nr:hypothetical protein [Colocasia esculenta]
MESTTTGWRAEWSQGRAASSHGISRHPSGVPGGYAGRFARSSSGGGSSSSGDDNLRELVHAASSHSSLGASPAGCRTTVVPRSQSAGMARIDEDGPCDFGGDAVVVDIIPRSRSCEVPKSRAGGWRPERGHAGSEVFFVFFGLFDWELGPEFLKVPCLGLQLCGLQVWCWLGSTVLWLVVVERQLDLSSVATRLRVGSCDVLSGLDTSVMNQ